jgi:hypothetical protein
MNTNSVSIFFSRVSVQACIRIGHSLIITRCGK